MADFTHGPWKTRKPEDSTGWVDINNDEGRAIITCWYGNNKNADANAKLIAAAPDMYEALKYYAESKMYGPGYIGADVEVAKQALAKAKEGK